MKKLVLISTLSLLASAAFADSTTADWKALRMINQVIQDCPHEFMLATENNNILNLTQVEAKDEKAQTVTTYTLTAGSFASPMGGSQRIDKTLIVVEVPHAIQPADGWLYDKTCTLK